MRRHSLPALLMAALLCAGCTADDAGPSPTDPTIPTTTVPATTTTTLGSVETLELFESCLADNGVEIEPITLDAQGRPRLDLVVPDIDFTNQDTVVAWSLCSSYLATGALDLNSNPILGEKVFDQLVEFSECVRSKGVDSFPDPIDGFSGIGNPYPPAEIPYADPALGPAVEACTNRITGGD